MHGRNGVVDNVAEDEADVFRQIRAFLSYLPVERLGGSARVARATTRAIAPSRS